MAQVNGLFHARQKWSVIWSSYLCSTLSTTAPLPRPLKCSTCLCCCKLASTFQTCSVCRFRFFHIVNPVGERLSWTRLQQGPDSSDIQSYYSVYAALHFFSTVTQQPPHPQLHSKSFTAWPKSSVTAKTRLWTRAWHVFHHYPTVPH